MRQKWVEEWMEANVSIHASVKDATEWVQRIISWVSFNPRICKRCDLQKVCSNMAILVSIHASVKDATYLQQKI